MLLSFLFSSRSSSIPVLLLLACLVALSSYRSREELPALRRELCAKTKHANRVVAEQCGSFAGEGYARIERDLTDDFVKLQVIS